MPTSFFLSFLSCLRPELLQIVIGSLVSGVFQAALKTPVIKPLLKKINLDLNLLNNNRPISNLSIVDKIIAKVCFNQINNFLIISVFYDNLQSGFHYKHSIDKQLI